MFDCKSQHHKCKAHCCGVVPLSNERWERNQDKVITQPNELVPAGGMVKIIENGNEIEIEGDLYPMTESGRCCFLKEDLSCNIYDDRPHICKKFGDETHPNMKCQFLDKTGRIRSRQESRKVAREQEKFTSSIMKKFEIFARE